MPRRAPFDPPATVPLAAWVVSNAYVSARFVELPAGKWRAVDVPLEIQEQLDEVETFPEPAEAPPGLLANNWRAVRLRDQGLGAILARFEARGYTVEKAQ